MSTFLSHSYARSVGSFAIFSPTDPPANKLQNGTNKPVNPVNVLIQSFMEPFNQNSATFQDRCVWVSKTRYCLTGSDLPLPLLYREDVPANSVGTWCECTLSDTKQEAVRITNDSPLAQTRCIWPQTVPLSPPQLSEWR